MKNLQKETLKANGLSEPEKNKSQQTSAAFLHHSLVLQTAVTFPLCIMTHPPSTELNRHTSPVLGCPRKLVNG